MILLGQKVVRNHSLRIWPVGERASDEFESGESKINMDIVFLLLPLAILLAAAFLYGFLWANHTGQLDDLETPAHRAILEDIEHQPEHNARRKISS